MKSSLSLFAILLPLTLTTAQCTGRLESINITITKSGTYPRISTTAVEFDWHRPMWIQQGGHSNFGMCQYWGDNYDRHYFVNTTVSKVPTLEFKNVDHEAKRNGTAGTDESELKWHLEAAGYDGIKLDVMDHGQLLVNSFNASQLICTPPPCPPRTLTTITQRPTSVATSITPVNTFNARQVDCWPEKVSCSWSRSRGE